MDGMEYVLIYDKNDKFQPERLLCTQVEGEMSHDTLFVEWNTPAFCVWQWQDVEENRMNNAARPAGRLLILWRTLKERKTESVWVLHM
jgi:hypothetical protein